jgi:hypothetical protein
MVTAGWCRQPYPGTVNPRTTWMHSARCLPSRHGSRLRADRSKSAYGRKVCTCSQPLLTERDGGRAPPTLQRVPPRSPRRCTGLVFTLTRHEYPRRGRHGFGPPGYPPGTVMKTSRGTPSPRPPGRDRGPGGVSVRGHWEPAARRPRTGSAPHDAEHDLAQPGVAGVEVRTRNSQPRDASTRRRHDLRSGAWFTRAPRGPVWGAGSSPG